VIEMKSRILSTLTILTIILLAFLLSGCPSPVGFSGSDTGSVQPATVAYDESRGLVVLTESDGSETVVSSLEGNQSIDCVDVTDYVLFDSDSSSRHSMGFGGGPRAIILGLRSDGRPGVWVLYHGGIVVIPEGDTGDSSSQLLEVVSEADGFRWDDGWDYTAIALSEDGRIIVGMAENPDAEWLASQLGSTPKVVVWWNLVDKGNGSFFLSRARVVAEYPEWDFHTVRSGRSGRDSHWYRYVWRWFRWFFDRLGLWFFAWADDYLGDLAEDPLSIEDVDVYAIRGYDKAGDLAEALITPYRVLSIAKADVVDPDENLPPWPVTGPVGALGFIEVSSETPWIQLEVGGSTNPADFDPDGDDVIFNIESFSIDDTDLNQYVIDNVEISSQGILSFNNWDPTLSFNFASFTITTDDGKVTTPTAPDVLINVYFQ
jgi:hypothetical protein